MHCKQTHTVGGGWNPSMSAFKDEAIVLLQSSYFSKRPYPCNLLLFSYCSEFSSCLSWFCHGFINSSAWIGCRVALYRCPAHIRNDTLLWCPYWHPQHLAVNVCLCLCECARSLYIHLKQHHLSLPPQFHVFFMLPWMLSSTSTRGHRYPSALLPLHLFSDLFGNSYCHSAHIQFPHVSAWLFCRNGLCEQVRSHYKKLHKIFFFIVLLVLLDLLLWV